MSSLLDSEAHFEKRASEIGMSGASLQALQAHGVATMGNIAHIIGTPGQPLADADVEVWMRLHLPAATLGDQASLRRLIWEGGALATAELKEQLTHPDSSAQKKVPEAERSRRMAHLRASLPGLALEGPLEPSFSLLDKAAAIERENQLRFLSPDVCVSRAFEVTNARPDKKVLELDDAKTLSVSSQADVPESPPCSALQLQEALLRRGVAFAFAQIVSFTSYQKYVTLLFQHLARDPPPDYQRCSVSQLARADRMVFERLIAADVKPRRDPSGVYALDTKLLEALESYQVSMLLMPLAAQRPDQRGLKRPAASASSGQFGRARPGSKWAKGRGRGVPAGKGKGRIHGPAVPKVISDLGGHAKTDDGKELCFNHNLEGCKNPHCKRLHVCAKCFKSTHTIRQCN